MRFVFILVDDGREVARTEDGGEALFLFIGLAEKARAMNGDIEGSLTAAWVDE